MEKYAIEIFGFDFGFGFSVLVLVLGENGISGILTKSCFS